MKKLRVYQYDKCSTCRNALKFLDGRGVEVDRVDITTKPPSKAELKKMLTAVGGELKRLFNTSGVVYRELGLTDKLKSMNQQEALDLLASNGRLIKRPFVLTEKSGFVGFNESEWKKAF